MQREGSLSTRTLDQAEPSHSLDKLLLDTFFSSRVFKIFYQVTCSPCIHEEVSAKHFQEVVKKRTTPQGEH